jgi:hypothetical protein
MATAQRDISEIIRQVERPKAVMTYLVPQTTKRQHVLIVKNDFRLALGWLVRQSDENKPHPAP